MAGEYDTAQVCPNGHVANDSVRRYPEHSVTFCERCGERTITACQKCGREIRGEYHVRGAFAPSEYVPPPFCHNCGTAFPWTERKIKAAHDLAADSGLLSQEELSQFSENIPPLLNESPQTAVAANRIKKLLIKVGAGTAQGIRDILVDIASEAAKKVIWPK
jgi:hypothetical protein